MKELQRLILILSVGLILKSCGGFGFLYQKHLTDDVWLIAVDEIEQMSVSLKVSENGYSGLIDETVFAVGFNKNYLIAKQHPRKFPEPPQKDSTNYYIIDLNKIRQEKANFISKIDTIKYRSVYKDINGKDSLGKENVQITKSKYVPDSPIKMSYDEYLIRRKKINLPDDLGFNYILDDLR
ncbi:hypothetical protein [Saccharicrinis aurantiacus]|uniref:hypothetical protein n=1 Tax=Saccharicrinis aurantiacus TaxID=1849719 RepID=UPI0024938913|nr:hypothetical protein [Saccharicrinis aurantiacus]